MKKILLLNAGFTEIPLINELHELGCYVITSGNRPEYPGHKLADHYIQADYSDKDALLEICKKEKLDGIVSNAFDLGLVATSYVAEKMGWKGHDTYENTMLIHQKDSLKQLCDELDIPAPKAEQFNNESDAIEYLDTAEYPIIVKAVDQASGIGVNKAEDRLSAVDAIKKAFEKSKEKRIIVEQYIVGNQESVNAFVVNGKVVCAVTCDSYSPINPYLIQTETLLSTNYTNLKDELIEYIERIFGKLHLVDGHITFQYLVKDGKPYVIDMMRRCLGNRYFMAAEAVSGYPWYKAVVMSELGMDCSKLKAEKPLGKYAGHHAIMATQNGIYEGMEIPKEIMDHVFSFYELFEKGQKINNYLNERLGYIFYTYEDREELDFAAHHFNEMIKLHIK